MRLRFACVLLLGAAIASAKSTTAPSTNDVDLGASTQPATSPTPLIGFHFPTTLPDAVPAAAAAEPVDNKLDVPYIDLDRPLSERPAAFSLLPDQSLTLQSVLSRLEKARDDKDVKAVLITLGQTGFNLSQAEEMRDILVQLRNSGKRVFIYADSYDAPGYVMATGCQDVCILQGGEIELPGVGIETMFAKGLLDKVGVTADYVQIGEYKGADEEYTRTDPSPELKGELDALVSNLYDKLIQGIADHRNVNKATVADVVDQSLISAQKAKEKGLVDHLVDIDGLHELIAKELNQEIELDDSYGQTPKESLDVSNPFALLQSLNNKPKESNAPSIAIICAEGVIVDGSADDDLLGGGGNVGADDFRGEIREALHDDHVKAIVIRIDSPGGSALASEAMWQSVRRAAKEKPVIVSVGGMAASGGYYLASSGDRIFADPTAIVGSIGVVGGKFVWKDLFDKLGLNVATFSKGKNAALFSNNEPWTDDQRKMVTSWMQETYQEFTERVMTTRKGKIKDIDAVARGRIFIAGQAKDLGMVDEIGGLDDAIAYAADQADLAKGAYELKILPQSRTLVDLIRNAISPDDESMPFQPHVQSPGNLLLQSLSPEAARLIKQQIEFLQILQQHPVMLASPYVVTYK